MGLSALNYSAVIENAISAKEESSHHTWVCQHFSFSTNSRFIGSTHRGVSGGEKSSFSGTLVGPQTTSLCMSKLPLGSGLDTRWIWERLAWEEESDSFTRRGYCITCQPDSGEVESCTGFGGSQLLPKLSRDSNAAANANVSGIGQHARCHHRK